MQETCLIQPSLYGPKVLGVRPDAAPRIRERLAPFVIRRRKADILPDLPPLRAVSVPLGITVAETRDISGQVQRLGVEDATIATIIDAGIPFGKINAASLASLQRLLGVAKARPAAMLVAMDLEGGVGKAVVFARHNAVIANLAHELRGYGPVVLDGSTPSGARQEAIDRFQADPSCRVFVGQIEACSTAITLTAASDLYVVEPAWTPATNAQAVQRCHRIGQDQPVLARFLFAEGTVDELVSRALARKAETTDALGMEDR
jgi:SNF2 family DNA or RNA helicase